MEFAYVKRGNKALINGLGRNGLYPSYLRDSGYKGIN